MRRRLVAVAVALLAAFPVGGLPQAAATQTLDCATRGTHNGKEGSWAQDRLQFKRVWPLTRGEGVAVAVIDSGIDPEQAQLDDQVVERIDLVGSGPQDCAGHGTLVAGIIAAEDFSEQAVPFAGVAPGADLIAVKQTDSDSDLPGGTRTLADAIRAAVDAGADVLNISIATTGTRQNVRYPELESAVKYAQSHDVVIVASVGNDDDQNNPGFPRYPASYPGVISVAAVDQQGKVTGFSATRGNVSVAAPGQQVLTTAVNRGYTVVQGTSFAAPFVAGVAALVRSHHPNLSYQQVKERIELTADALTDPAAGAGMVNPYQAVTAVLPSENQQGREQPIEEAAREPIPPVARQIPPDTETRNKALALAGGGAAAAGLMLVGAAVIPRGRRRRWRPGRRGPLPDVRPGTRI